MTVSTRWYLTPMVGGIVFMGDTQRGPALLRYIVEPMPAGLTLGVCDGPGLGVMAVSMDDTLLPTAQQRAITDAIAAAPARDVFDPGVALTTSLGAWAKLGTMMAMAPAAFFQDLPATGTVGDVFRQCARNNLLYQEIGWPEGAVLATPMANVTTRARMATRMTRYPANMRPTATGTVGEFFLPPLRSGLARFGLSSGVAHWGRKEANLG